MKTSVKYFCLAVGPRSGTTTSSQNWPKTYLTYDVTHRKNNTKPKIFLLRFKDLLSLLKVWTAL